MRHDQILVLGGAGFIGRHIVARLAFARRNITVARAFGTQLIAMLVVRCSCEGDTWVSDLMMKVEPSGLAWRRSAEQLRASWVERPSQTWRTQ